MKRGYSLLAVVVLLIGMLVFPSYAASPDWNIPNGHFFTQTSDGGNGFVVADDGQGRFWSEFQRIGGVAALGYPVSQRFQWGGFTCQAFQRAVLQWHTELHAVALVNVFDLLHDDGKDDWLIAVRQVPRPVGPDFDAGLTWDQTVQKRLALLDANPAIKAKYFAVVGDPIQMNGLPTSPVTDMGNNYTIRCQRVVIQQWKENVPWAQAGDVTVANGGDIAKETGLLPAAALVPQSPSSIPSGAASTTLDPSQAPWPGGTGPDARFGTVQVSEVHDGNTRAADLGLSWSRELYLWSSLGDSPDVSRLQYTDRYYSTSLRIVGLIQFTPPYAAGGQLDPPAGIRLAWNDPGNTFGQFAFEVAKAKVGQVDTWIIWNEPDICSPSMFGYSWTGSPEDYYYMLKTGYQAIKAANPNATVIFGSLGIVAGACHTDGTDTTFFNRWLAEARRDNAAAGNWYFDAMSLNLHKEPERIYEMIGLYKSLMRQNGFDKPVWLMETSVPLAGTDSAAGQDFAVGKGDQQSYLIQAYANALAAGADHLSVYKLAYFSPGDPAYNTLKVAMKYMAGTQSAAKYPDIGGQPAYRYDGTVRIVLDGAGFRTTVVYNRATWVQSIRVPATAAYAYLADKNGNERVITPQDGFYTLDLEGATGIYHGPWGSVTFIGGSPLMLREPR